MPSYFGNDTDLTSDKIKQLSALGYTRVSDPSQLTSGDIVIGGAGATGGISDSQLNGASRLWGNDRNQTASVLEGFIQSASKPPVYDPTADIQALKNAQINASISALDKARQSSLSNLDQQKSEVEPRYYQSRNSASTQSQLGAKSFAEYLANRGLTNSGSSTGFEQNRIIDLQGALTGFKNAQNKEYSDIARNVTNTNNAFESDKASAIAGAEANALNQLIAAKQAQAEMANQNYWNSKNYGLSEANLTGYLNGSPTMAKTQQDFINALDMRQQTFAEAQAQIQNAIQRGQLSISAGNLALAQARQTADNDPNSLDNQIKAAQLAKLQNENNAPSSITNYADYIDRLYISKDSLTGANNVNIAGIAQYIKNLSDSGVPDSMIDDLLLRYGLPIGKTPNVVGGGGR
jgi:hypothetical protein